MSNPGTPIGTFDVSRKSAKGIIHDMATSLYKGTRALQVLEQNIRWDNLTQEEEEALWEFFIYLRGRLR